MQCYKYILLNCCKNPYPRYSRSTFIVFVKGAYLSWFWKASKKLFNINKIEICCESKKKYLQNKFLKVKTDRPLKNKFSKTLQCVRIVDLGSAKKLIEKEIFVLSKSGITTKSFFVFSKSKFIYFNWNSNNIFQFHN